MEDIDSAKAIMLIGTNPRLEAPVLNARIRKAWLRGATIGLVGQPVDLTYDYAHLGTGHDALKGLFGMNPENAHGKNTLVIGLPDFAARLQGHLLGLVPGKPFTIDNHYWLQQDSVCTTPALIGLGASALYANAAVEEQQRLQAERILAATGITVWVSDESELDAVTAVSGSGPAYYFLIMEAMEAAALKLGLPVDTARLLNLQTALGAARMAMESSEPPQTLRTRVTSPGGTTAAALQVLQAGNLQTLFDDALAAARYTLLNLPDQLVSLAPVIAILGSIVALASLRRSSAIQVISVRGGHSLGQRNYFPAQSEGHTEADILQAFLGQYYRDKHHR